MFVQDGIGKVQALPYENEMRLTNHMRTLADPETRQDEALQARARTAHHGRI